MTDAAIPNVVVVVDLVEDSRYRRVGLLYPGHAAEDDYPALQHLLGLEAELRVVHTSVGEDAHRVDALLDLGSAERLAEGARELAGGARELAGTGVDAVIWACTGGSFVFGWEGAGVQVEQLSRVAGVPASSTSFAFVNAAATLGVRRVAVAATYPDDVAEHFARFLGAAGIEVLGLTGRGIVTAADVGTLGRDAVLRLATQGDHPGADAVLLPDTALHTVAWLDEMERLLGKPVLSANQVTVWEGLRLAGHRHPHRGAGTLFRTPPCPHLA